MKSGLWTCFKRGSREAYRVHGDKCFQHRFVTIDRSRIVAGGSKVKAIIQLSRKDIPSKCEKATYIRFNELPWPYTDRGGINPPSISERRAVLGRETLRKEGYKFKESLGLVNRINRLNSEDNQRLEVEKRLFSCRLALDSSHESPNLLR